MSLPKQVAVVVLLPFAAYLAAAGSILRSDWVQRTRAQEVLADTELFKSFSTLVREVQKERAQAGLLASGRASEEEVRAKRDRTDAVAAELLRGLPATRLVPAERTAVDEAWQRLPAYRQAADDEAPTVAGDYASLVATLQTAQASLADITALPDFAARFRGAAVLEQVREGAGGLRALVETLLREDKPIGSAELSRVVELNQLIRTTLSLRGLDLAPSTKAKAKELMQGEHWRATAEIIAKVTEASATGHFGVDPATWVAAQRKVIDDLSSLADAEVSVIPGAALKLRDDASLTTVLNAACLLALAALSGWLALRFRRRTVAPLVDLTKQLGQLAATTQASSVELGDTSAKVSAAATEQAAAVQETDAAMAETASMLALTAQQAGEADGLATQASSRTAEGRQAVAGLLAAMDAIAASNAKLSDVSGIIAEIARKTDVINEIAFKTQLLSFNASIEAARAGQHGRGFAVVANEVGSLATTSSKAATEIAALLETSTARVRSLVDETSQRVDDGRRTTRDVETTFQQLATATTAISSAVAQIRDAAREQEAGARQISAAVSQLNTATGETQRLAGENAGVAQRLESQSTQLLSLETLGRRLVSGAVDRAAAAPAPLPEPATPDASGADASSGVSEALIERLARKAERRLTTETDTKRSA